MPPSPPPRWGCEVDSEVTTRTTAAIRQRLLVTAPAGPHLVGVDGRSGSGKTHLTAQLAGDLRRHRVSVVVISMDDLYPGWDGLSASLPRLCQGVIEPLSRGRSASYRRYDWDKARFAETVDVPWAEVVIIEGVGSTAHACRDDLTTTVWVHATSSVRMDRAHRRTGQGDFGAYGDRWTAQEEQLFGLDTYPQAPSGYDIVVDTTPDLPDHEPAAADPSDG